MKPKVTRKPSTAPRQPVPASLRVFAWNLGPRVSREGQRQIALNVIERGRAWHWRQLPKGWFDLAYCLDHGQKRTKEFLHEVFKHRLP